MKRLPLVALALGFLGIAAVAAAPDQTRDGKEDSADSVVVLKGQTPPAVVVYKPEMKTADAIRVWGGLSELGSVKIFVIRGGSVVLATAGKRVFGDPGMDNIALKPWDVVSEGERNAQDPIVVVIGEVRAPLAVPFTPKLKVADAIGLCGGVSDWGETKISIIRGGKVILKTTGKLVSREPNPGNIALKSWDIVSVGEPERRHARRK